MSLHESFDRFRFGLNVQTLIVWVQMYSRALFMKKASDRSSYGLWTSLNPKKFVGNRENRLKIARVIQHGNEAVVTKITRNTKSDTKLVLVIKGGHMICLL